MAQNNQTLTDIAIKRLSGKANTNAKSSTAQEPIGSTIQTVAGTVFAEVVPNDPINDASTHLFVVQSASLSDPGTVMLVDFEVVAIGDEYQNDFSNTNDELDEGDNDPSGNPNTYHSYGLILSGTFQSNATSNGFNSNASTGTSLGSAPFIDGYFMTGSRGKLQIVPEFVSSTPAGIGANNTYTPVLYNNTGVPSAGTVISPTAAVDWYLDPYSGVLFIQDPVDFGTANPDGSSPNSDSSIPGILRAFIYVGKYQDEVTFGSADVNFKVSGSDDGFDVGNTDTINFISGSAGITVLNDGTDTITIGASTDNITVNQITASIVNANKIEVSEFIVSSSVSYITSSFSSGSTIFGDTNDDTHQFTGSVSILYTGSNYGLSITGSGINVNSGDNISISASGHITASALYLHNEFTALGGGVTIDTSGAPELNVAGNITSSGIISASGELFAGIPEDTDGSALNTVVYNTSTGQFEYTGSYGAADTTDLDASASAGIYFSGSTGGGESIGLMQTASFIGGTGTTVTYAAGDNTLTFANTTPIFLGTGSSAALATGSSIPYAGTASFTSSGAGLSVDTDGSAGFTYTISPQNIFDAFDTANTGSFTASFANTASYVISASYAETASKVSVLDNNTSDHFGIVFTNDTGSNAQLYHDSGSGKSGLIYSPGYTSPTVIAPTLFLSGTVNPLIELNADTAPGPIKIQPTLISATGSTFNMVAAQGGPSNTDTTLNFGFQTNTINIGAELSSNPTAVVNFRNDITVAGSASIEGDLIIKGAVTSIQTTNLNVEDQFILLNSGSTTGDGGIIIQTANIGGVASGPALYLDSTYSRFAVKKGMSWDQTGDVTIDGTTEFLVTVSSSTTNPTTNPQWYEGGSPSYGQMFVNTSTGEFFLYS